MRDFSLAGAVKLHLRIIIGIRSRAFEHASDLILHRNHSVAFLLSLCSVDKKLVFGKRFLTFTLWVLLAKLFQALIVSANI